MSIAELLLGQMGWRNTVRYAISDMRYRRAATLGCSAAVTIACLYFLVFGLLAHSAYDRQRELLSQESLERIDVTAPNVTDPSTRFGPAKMESVRALRGAAFAQPLFELNVRAAMPAGPNFDLIAEGAAVGSPEIAAAKLVSGRPLRAATEAVISRSLFEKMGYKPNGPARLQIEVARSRNGIEQIHRTELEIVGLLRRPDDRRIYILDSAAEQLELWCTSKLETLSGGPAGQASSRTGYPAAIAWVPKSEEWRLETERQHFNIGLKRGIQVTVLEADASVWATVSRTDGLSLRSDELEELRTATGAVRYSVVSTASVCGLTLAALPDDDPRAGLAAREPGTVRLREGVEAPARSWRATRVPRIAAATPIGADGIASRETLRWLTFDPASAVGVETRTLVSPTARRAFAKLQARWGSFPGSHEGWAVLLGSQAQAERLVLEASVTPGIRQASFVSEGDFLRRAADNEASRTVRIRFVPDWLFEEVFSRKGTLRRGASVFDKLKQLLPFDLAGKGQTILTSGVWVVPDAGTKVEEIEFGFRRVTVAATAVLGTESPCCWLRSAATELVPVQADAHGVAIQGRWDAIAALAAKQDRLDFAETDGLPCPGPVLAREAASAVERALGDDAGNCRIGELTVLPREDSIFAGAFRSGRAPFDDPEVSASSILVATGAEFSLERLLAGEKTSITSHIVRVSWLPAGLIVLPVEVFERLVFRSQPARDWPWPERVDFEFADTLELKRAQSILLRRGLRAKPLTALLARNLVRYEIRDASGDGTVDEGLLAALRSARPTFAWIEPVRKIRGKLGGDVEFEASSGSDPARFGAGLLTGRWLGGPSDNQVVLPESLARALAGLGRERALVTATFSRRPLAGMRQEMLEVPLSVAGTCADAQPARIPDRLARNLLAWQRGDLSYNAEKLCFESPVETALVRGSVRCSVFATNLEAVPRLVAELRAMGYETRDRLADQESLQRFARLLALFVLAFVGGYLMLAAAMVFSSTSQNVRSKMFEIGILKAMGVAEGDILRIFLVQGLAIGVLAYVLAFASAAALESVLRAAISQLPGGEALSGSIWNPALSWLHVTALGISVVFSLMGVAVPALSAARMSPLAALRCRE